MSLLGPTVFALVAGSVTAAMLIGQDAPTNTAAQVSRPDAQLSARQLSVSTEQRTHMYFGVPVLLVKQNRCRNNTPESCQTARAMPLQKITFP